MKPNFTTFLSLKFIGYKRNEEHVNQQSNLR